MNTQPCAPDFDPIVRQFSGYGPCIGLGELLRETDKFYIYFGDDYKAHRVSKDKAHISVCKSCTDHENTMYPHGYMD